MIGGRLPKILSLRKRLWCFTRTFFCSNDTVKLDALLLGGCPILGTYGCNTLLAPIYREEVRVAVMNMRSFKAPALNGF